MLTKRDLMIVSGGKIVRGFDQVSVQFSIDSLFGEFDLTIKRRWTESKDIPFKIGDPCTIFLSGKHFITGFIDYLSFGFGPDGSSVEIYGRSKSVDAAESCLELKSNQFRGKQSVKSVSDKLLEPFGISLIAETSIQNEKLEDWKIEPGERVGDALIRIAKTLRLNLFGLPSGNLFLGKAFQCKAAGWVRQGDNLEQMDNAFDGTELFNKYIVRGEKKDSKTAKTKPVKGETDPDYVRKGRLLVIPYEGLTDQKKAASLAKWEKQVRHGRAYNVSAVVSGWTNPKTGMPWEVNTLVTVDCIKASIKKDLLISEVSFDYNEEQGHTTSLELKHPDSFAPEPPEIKPESKEDHLKKYGHLING